MADASVKHDYHLVNPSPWPLVASISATVMAIGGVIWMKGLFGIDKGTPWVFFAGLAGILYTMVGWWSDVVKEANQGDHTPVVSIGLRYGMILFIASEVMFFVAWFWMFFEMALFHEHRTLSAIEEVRTAWATWPPTGVETVPAWHLPLVNTLTLLLSGTTVTWAHHAIQQDDRKGAKIALTLTIILGVLFSCIQAYEYHHILEHKYFFSEEAANSGLYGSTFFMATGFHGFHVLVGTIFLAVCLLRLMRGGFTPQKHFGFEAAAWYWHFVDVVWLFLFAFIYVVFAGAGAH
ncbi:cytochrome c oxidase subunit 3 [Phenylobacterium deserti]|uniref:Probable cytochrome c oxidase subunit 3 n=1 Tax=Phenylobacterium deserti TaxID=1914756 RepID=A0A328AQD1_9CAUL|nr:cytochrome c oxidase subunit 3 [Phenylobacterium deserti]RAK56769.1 cytochrome c oxidase subunit 3 [Phenylobacterium deserti]